MQRGKVRVAPPASLEAPAVAEAMAGQAHTDPKDKNLDRIYRIKGIGAVIA